MTKRATTPTPERAFQALLRTVTGSGGVFFFLGRTDVGKSTVVQGFVRLLAAQRATVMVLDVDLGQSTYGLPTTLNLVRFSVESEPPVPECLASIFVGSTSPVGHLLQVVIGCRRLLDRARQLRPHAILIDSTGFVEGPLAIEFKLQKLDLLRPRHIVTLARGKELDPIFRACQHRADLRLHRLPVSPAARERSAEERRDYRRRKYHEYFATSQVHRLDWEAVGVWGRMPPPPATDLLGLLVGLNDAEGFCLGVGLLSNLTDRFVEVETPLAAITNVQLLRFGSVALDQEKNERFIPPRAW